MAITLASVQCAYWGNTECHAVANGRTSDVCALKSELYAAKAIRDRNIEHRQKCSQNDGTVSVLKDVD